MLLLTLVCSSMVKAQDLDLRGLLNNLVAADTESRSKAFYALISPFWGDSGDVEKGMVGLLNRYPEEAERIRAAMIRTLDMEAEYEFGMMQQGKAMSELWAGYDNDLLVVVGTFRDQRAVRGLLAGLGTGGIADNALGDLCPGSIDSLIQAFHEPERFFQGSSMNWRSGAIAAIGGCLHRPLAMRSDPKALDRARSTLLLALDDADANVRAAAALSLSVLRNEPLVRSRLEHLMRADAFVRKASPNERLRTTEPQENGKAYGVREVAAYVLGMSDDKYGFFVVRSAQNGECKVQASNDSLPGEKLIGPFISEAQAVRSMCRHIDGTTTRADLCWRTVPRDACSQ